MRLLLVCVFLFTLTGQVIADSLKDHADHDFYTAFKAGNTWGC